MQPQNVRKVYKYKLTPTSEQARLLKRTLILCVQVYKAAIGERREAWRLYSVSVTYYQQKAELPGIKEAMPEYAEVHSQVLQEVVLRVERTFQAFFHRIRDGKTPGYPRFQSSSRYHSFTYPQYVDTLPG
jgi:putative transposase